MSLVETVEANDRSAVWAVHYMGQISRRGILTQSPSWTDRIKLREEAERKNPLRVYVKSVIRMIIKY